MQPAPFRTPQQRHLLPADSGAGAGGSLADLEASLPRGIMHAASTTMLADLSAFDLMAQPLTPTAAGAAVSGQGPLGGSVTTSAFASSVVDTSGHVDTGGAGGSRDGEEGMQPHGPWLDPDLHDTFGAHAIGPLAPAAPAPAPARLSASASPRMHQKYDAVGALRSKAGEGAPDSAAAALASPAKPGAGAGGARPTSMLEPSSVPGQHSVTATDPSTSVPSLEFLRQRRATRQRLDEMCSEGGYIAEAKRVLSQAMSTADPLETLLVQSRWACTLREGVPESLLR